MNYWLKEIELEAVGCSSGWIYDDVSDDTVDEINSTQVTEIQLLVRVDEDGWFDLNAIAEEAVVELIDERDIILVGNDRNQLVENFKAEINRVVNEG